MKASQSRITLSSLISERLAAIGATNIPTPARQLIEDEVWQVVAGLVQRRVTAPVVGRAVARALSASADSDQGFKGGTPLTSSDSAQSAQGRVAGHSINPQIVQANDTTSGEQ